MSFDNGELTHENSITIKTSKVLGEKAYSITAGNQGKVKIKPSLLTGKTTFTFRAMVPDGSGKLDGMGEFAIRTKSSSSNGYISYNSSNANGQTAIPIGEWKTYTLNISSYSTNCTEFSFIVPAGNTLYIKDLAFE